MRWPLTTVLACGVAFAQAPPASLGTARWREDLKFFAEKFSAAGIQLTRGVASRGEKDLNKLYPHFRTDLAALDGDLANLSDPEIVLRLMRIVASGNVAHNQVYTPFNMGFFRRLPVTLFWFSDGLAVTQASKDYSGMIGARVLRIGTMTPEAALAAVAPYVSHENEVGLRTFAAADLLVKRAMLEHLKLLDAEGRVLFTLQKPGGEVFTLATPVDDPRVPKLDLTSVAPFHKPLYLDQPDSFYWYRYLADSQTFYIQYNRCANDPKHPFGNFVRAAMEDADARAADHAIRRVVVDLRLNGGGDSRVVEPLTKALALRSKTLGPVVALIGPFTFSSAEMAAIQLRDELHATLVGSPTGEKPNGYGDIDIITLPNSKLRISFSTKFFRLVKGDPSELDPDIVVPLTLADALDGRDAVLEAAISHQ